MAKITELPALNIIGGFKGVIDYYVHNGQPCARKWPRSPGHFRAPAVEAHWTAFSYINQAYRYLPPIVIEAYRQNASCTMHTSKDIATRNYITSEKVILIGE